LQNLIFELVMTLTKTASLSKMMSDLFFLTFLLRTVWVCMWKAKASLHQQAVES